MAGWYGFANELKINLCQTKWQQLSTFVGIVDNDDDDWYRYFDKYLYHDFIMILREYRNFFMKWWRSPSIFVMNIFKDLYIEI